MAPKRQTSREAKFFVSGVSIKTKDHFLNISTKLKKSTSGFCIRFNLRYGKYGSRICRYERIV